MSHLPRFSAAFVCMGLFVSAASAQSNDAKVRYRDPGTDKEESVTGRIQKESPAGITLKPPDKTIAATRIIDVEYPAPSFTTSRDLRAARNAEAAGDRATALKLYHELLPKLTDSPLKRHTEYTIARLTAKQAETESAQAKAAIQLLLDYQRKY